MELEEVMARLEAEGSAKVRAVYAAHGVSDGALGVGFGPLRQLAGQIGRDGELARALWVTGCHEARVLATLIADPHELSLEDLEAWTSSCDNYLAADALSGLAARTAHAQAVVEAWHASERDPYGQVAWNLVSVLAQATPRPDQEPIADEWFLPLLGDIEQHVHQRGNRTRHAMVVALCALASGRPELREQTMHIAAAIGDVHVDHGESGGSTPKPLVHIQRIWGRDVRRARLKHRIATKKRSHKEVQEERRLQREREEQKRGGD